MERTHRTRLETHLSNHRSSPTSRCNVSWSRKERFGFFSFLLLLLFRPLFNQLAEHVERLAQVRRPKELADFHMENDRRASLYKTSSIDEMTEEKLSCAVSILPQVDPLPSMFTYVSLQRNFLVRFLRFSFRAEFRFSPFSV